MTSPTEATKTRLNRAVADGSGVGRRQADEMIADGRIKVNGVVCLAHGTKVGQEDELQLDGRILVRPASDEYWLFHKPIDVECSFLPHAGYGGLEDWVIRNPGIRYGGRLDRNSEGLLLLSTDGTWLNRLTHPSGGWEKKYTLEVRGLDANVVAEAPSEVEESEELLEKGSWVQTGTWPADIWEVILHQGRKRHIRRLVQHWGGHVVRLQRTAVGPFVLGDLTAGEARQLSREEAYRPLPSV